MEKNDKNSLKRDGNVELRKMSRNDRLEIVVWQKNRYYGAEGQMKDEGWEFDSDGNASRGNCHVHGSCFHSEETCYTAAYVELYDDGDYDVKSVGRRAFSLEHEDSMSFGRILDEVDKLAYEHARSL